MPKKKKKWGGGVLLKKLTLCLYLGEIHFQAKDVGKKFLKLSKRDKWGRGNLRLG